MITAYRDNATRRQKQASDIYMHLKRGTITCFPCLDNGVMEMAGKSHRSTSHQKSKEPIQRSPHFRIALRRKCVKKQPACTSQTNVTSPPAL
ncbi:hypothetical protein L596_022410 [Steinernema carpocapsae]|uniref:Uncharacterized protein n=1 Tax=Steinernema carpocapsae TaxID=34508 RepID=A0A4U5MLL9_STECR|nr:hypothetical protein L596_022410 [Steinernema carpocapsae]